MRVDIVPIVNSVRMLLGAIDDRRAEDACGIAGVLLDFLPPDNFADPEPGVTVCHSMPEYSFKNLLPYLRGSVRKWHGWLTSVHTLPHEWPAPDRLRSILESLESIRESLGIPADAMPAETADV